MRKLIPKKIWNKIVLPYHFVEALLGNIIYGFPGRKIKIIGVTGTNGKSTTCLLITRMLEAAGHRVGLSSTVMFKIGEREWMNDTNKTVLGRFFLPKFLRQVIDAGCDIAVVEVTSHAIVQYRVWGVNFDTAVFTNLAPEHLDYHETFTNYRNAKGRLIKGAKNVVINADDKEFEYFNSFKNQNKVFFAIDKQTVKTNGSGITLVAVPHKHSALSTEFSVHAYDANSKNFLNQKVVTTLLGEFNVYNAIAALGTILVLGEISPKSFEVLANFSGVPGRMERFVNKEGKVVIVDYAHTPDAFEALFQTIKKINPGHRLITVFGATGDRDRTKRPKMGNIACRFADTVILTNEEPYTEKPENIIRDIESGIPPDKKSLIKIIPKRDEAIREAIKEATPGDIITVTGMGHQKYAIFGDKKIPWDDRKIVTELLNEDK